MDSRGSTHLELGLSGQQLLGLVKESHLHRLGLLLQEHLLHPLHLQLLLHHLQLLRLLLQLPPQRLHHRLHLQQLWSRGRNWWCDHTSTVISPPAATVKQRQKQVMCPHLHRYFTTCSNCDATGTNWWCVHTSTVISPPAATVMQWQKLVKCPHLHCYFATGRWARLSVLCLIRMYCGNLTHVSKISIVLSLCQANIQWYTPQHTHGPMHIVGFNHNHGKCSTETVYDDWHVSTYTQTEFQPYSW